jgi:ATP-dependent Clp protease ATP-binding subunit ClpA
MFGRFTDEARWVLAVAQEEAKAKHRGRTGTEHILLGLVQERDGIAAEALESLGITLDAVRQQVDEMTGTAQEAPATTHNQYTMRAKRALDLSLREALQLGHHHIGTEHILLGLLREGEGPAAQVLTELGADLSRVRQQVIGLLGEAEGDGGHQVRPLPPPRQAAPGSPAPSGYTVPPGAGGSPLGQPDPGSSAESRMLAEILSRLEALDSRLSTVERQMGTGPDVRDLDQQIAATRRDKETASAAEDYEQAAAMRDQERRLQADKAALQQDWSAPQLDLPSLAEGLHMLSDEVGRLRGLLSQQGSKRDGAA